MGYNLADNFYWFYSTLTQSLAAFLGIVGVFAIFRLQIQHVFVEDSFSKLRNFMLQRDPRSNELKISAMNFKELLKHSSDLNNFWANKNMEYDRQIRDLQKRITVATDSAVIAAINQNVGSNRDFAFFNDKMIMELRLLNKKCIHSHAEKEMISSKGLHIIRHLCIALVLSIFGLYFVKELASLLWLSNYSRFIALALIFYIFFIGMKVLEFFKRCLKGDFFDDAFKDVEKKKG